MRKKILSVVIIISMVFNIAISHVAIFAECIDDIGEEKVTDEIKSELGLDETSQIDDSIWESVSSTSETDFVEDKEDDYDKNDVYEKECDEEQSTSIEQTDNETSDVEDEFSIEKVVATSSKVKKEMSFDTSDDQLFGNGVSYTLPYNWYSTDATSRSVITKITIKKGGDVPTGVETVISGELKYYEDGTEIVIYCADANDNILMGETSALQICGVFTNFSSLTEIESLDLLDTRNVVDMSWLFSGCSSLDSLDLSNFNTSNTTSMREMFSNCSGLTSLDLSSFDTSNVTIMIDMFSTCCGLTSIDLSSFNTSSVTNMLQMFYGCSSLTSLDLSNFNTSNVTNMGSIFFNCSALTSIDLSGFDISNLTSLRNMFYNCRSLTNIDLSSFDTSNVTDMSSMFYLCSGLTSLDLSTFNTANVTTMASMFNDCSSLTSINLNNFNTISVSIMGGMFGNCRSITNIDLSSFDTSNVISMAGMFSGCSNLTSLDLGNFNTSSVTSMLQMFYGCSSLTSLDLSNFNTSNVTNMDSIFYNCSGLTSIDLSGLDISNLTSLEKMFYNCSSLTSIDLSSFDTSNVTNMGSMFYLCSGLTSLDLSTFNTANVTNMSSMFYKCQGLISIDLSTFNTASVTSMRSMFEKCNSLVSFDLSGFNTSNVTDMYNMFCDCNNLTSLDLSSFDISNVTTMTYMLFGMESLSYLKISNSISNSINDVGVRGDWKDLGTGITYTHDTSGRSTIPTGGGEYQRVDSYTIDFYRNGGNWVAPYVAPTTRYYTEGVILPTADNIIKANNVFGGWYIVDGSITGNWDDTYKRTEIQANTEGSYIFYARWNPLYLVTFEMREGEMTDTAEIVNIPANQNVETGTCATRPAPNPSSSGFRFDGWFTDNTFTTEFNFDDAITGPTTIHAKWHKIQTITFNFDLDGHGTNFTQQVTEDTRVVKPANPTASGYIFEYWYENNINVPFDFTQIIPSTSDNPRTLKAKWNRIQTITFNFDLDGHGTNFTQQVIENTRLAKPATPTAVGYIFEYWYEIDENVSFDFEQIIPSTSDNLRTLKAKWRVDSSGSGSRTGGNGGGGGGGANNSPSLIIVPTHYVSQVKTIIAEVDSSQVVWTYDPIGNQYKMSVIRGNQIVPAMNGCYIINSIVEQNINGIASKNLINRTYYFDKEGNMLTGWIKTLDDKWYFTINDKTIDEGSMVFGWRKIQDKWYYFTPEGSMLVNTVTPDGYHVGTDGACIDY